MKDEDALPSTTPITKKEMSDSIFFGKGGYKFWALAAILLLALWSMFTGTVSLRWSGSLNSLSSIHIDTPLHDDLDVLVRISISSGVAPSLCFKFGSVSNLMALFFLKQCDFYALFFLF